MVLFVCPKIVRSRFESTSVVHLFLQGLHHEIFFFFFRYEDQKNNNNVVYTIVGTTRLVLVPQMGHPRAVPKKGRTQRGAGD